MHYLVQLLCFILFVAYCHASVTECHFYNSSTCSGSEKECGSIEKCGVDEKYQCYVLWKNSTNGTVSVILKGCYISKDGNCKSKDGCARGQLQKKDPLLFFCCCNDNLCNDNFAYYPTAAPPKEKDEEKPSPKENNVVLYACIALLLSVAVFVSTMFCLKKKRRLYFSTMPSFSQRDHLLPSPTPILFDRKQMREVIGKGKFGVVRKAVSKNGFVAVKIMPREQELALMDEEKRKGSLELEKKSLFEQEQNRLPEQYRLLTEQHKQAWLTEQEVYQLPLINHENILRFIAAEKHDDNGRPTLWLITDYHQLGSLLDYLKMNTLSWDQLCHIIFTMARGLSYLHEEIPSSKVECYKPAVAHRDFKSSNVLLKNPFTACISDFGLSLIFKASRSCGDTHGQVGTRRYMAPEVLEGAINFSRDAFLRIDMYACGLVLWELVSRCNFQQGIVPDYKLPFEKEVSHDPSLEDMQEIVVHKKMRPIIEDSWRKHPGLATICDTIEELWDHDAEARLSADCIIERILHHCDP